MIGSGLPGVTKINDFFEGMENVDLVCFFDVGDGDLQDYLRSKGKRVFGTGAAGELEYDRVKFKKILKKVGLPVVPYSVLTGVKELEQALSLKENIGKWVKVSTFRGICETFQNKGIKFAQPKIDTIAMKLGAARGTQEFILEDSIPGVEIGNDCFISGGRMLGTVTFGLENKDKSYTSKVMKVDKLPDAVKEVDSALAPVYKKLNICGMISSEIRVGEDKKPYFIDMCARAGSPPAEVISELYSNFSEIVWAVAGGEEIEPKAKANYAAEVLIKSEMAPTDWVPLDFREKDLKVLKLRNLCKMNGQYYYIPQDNGTIIGAAIGLGNTAEEAEKEALLNCELLDCEESHYDSCCFEEESGKLDKTSK
jgi:phosphoribosylamine-glycine ligase